MTLGARLSFLFALAATAVVLACSDETSAPASDLPGDRGGGAEDVGDAAQPSDARSEAAAVDAAGMLDSGSDGS